MQHRWGKLTGVVFIDLCKAFDTVNHQVLLHKLFSFGICQNTGSFKWFWLYLCGRSHCVKWNGVFLWQKRCYYWSAPWVHIGSVVFIYLLTIILNAYTVFKCFYIFRRYITGYVSHKIYSYNCTKLHDDLVNSMKWMERILLINLKKTLCMLIGIAQKLSKCRKMCIKVDILF